MQYYTGLTFVLRVALESIRKNQSSTLLEFNIWQSLILNYADIKFLPLCYITNL